VTRACLEELATREGLSVSIITKSNQIVRDIDVLKRIAERSNLGIDITITTLRAGLTRLLERARRGRTCAGSSETIEGSGAGSGRVGFTADPGNHGPRMGTWKRWLRRRRRLAHSGSFRACCS